MGAAAMQPDSAADGSGGKQTVTLRYRPAGSPQMVYVVGTFNHWDKTANPLTKQPDGKTWTGSIAVEPGIYQYLFVVDGKQWLPDPAAPRVLDPNANANSILTVPPAEFLRVPGRVGDGRITLTAIRHRTTRADIGRIDDARIWLALRTRRNDVQRCELVVRGAHRAVPLRRYDSDAFYDYWRAPVAARHLLQYVFHIVDGPTRVVYGPRGVEKARRTAAWFTLNPASYPVLKTPDWLRDSVFYQIFPDRFANGNPRNDGAYTLPWGAKPDHIHRFGGDLAGVAQHLAYLRALGVNAIYFNPIFATESNHGYDTTDYARIDARLGTNRQFKELVRSLHGLGWHVILDGVFHSTSVQFGPFRDLREKGPASRYAAWYFPKRFPLEVREGQTTYGCWFGVYTLPRLNTGNPQVRRFLLGVAQGWIRSAHIDGWRLDSADELDHGFWKELRGAVKAENPQAYLLGEIWTDAHEWLQGDEFDSVMNYRWRTAALDFFVHRKTSPTQFATAIERIRDDYPSSANRIMFNLLGSHDTERLRTLCRGDRGAHHQAVLFQITYPGVPCIYYGDEVGLEGGRDPDDRRCMPWDPAKWDRKTLAFYRKAIALRKSHPALRRGSFHVVLTDDAQGVFGFQRTLGSDRLLVLFNRSGEPARIRLPGAWGTAGRITELMNGDQTSVSPRHPYRLPPYSVAVLSRTRSKEATVAP